MINESFLNAFYGTSNVLLLVVTTFYTNMILYNPALISSLYPGSFYASVLTSLVANIGLVIFGLLILGNLNDFLQKRLLNLIGAHQKLRIMALLVLLNGCVYSTLNAYCFFTNWSSLSSGKYSAIWCSGLVTSAQSILVFSIYLLHPDLLGLRLHRKMKEYLESRSVYQV